MSKLKSRVERLEAASPPAPQHLIISVRGVLPGEGSAFPDRKLVGVRCGDAYARRESGETEQALRDRAATDQAVAILIEDREGNAWAA